MKKNVRLISRFYQNSLLMIMVFGVHMIHGMKEEEEETEKVSKAIIPVDTTRFFHACLDNEIKRLARAHAVQRIHEAFVLNIYEFIELEIQSSLIKHMNFPSIFAYPALTKNDISRLVTLYTNTYNFFNLSLCSPKALSYSTEESQQSIFLSIVQKSILSKRLIKSIDDIQNKDALIYTGKNLQDLFSMKIDNTVDRILLQNIKFNNIAKIQDNIKINDTIVSDEHINTLALLQDQDGQTLIHLLCETLGTGTEGRYTGFTDDNTIDLIQKLLLVGADPNILNSLGYTPLHILCNKDVKVIDRNLIEFFLKHIPSNKHKKQASPNIQFNISDDDQSQPTTFKTGQTTTFKTKQTIRKKTPNQKTPLHILCQKICRITNQSDRQTLLDIIKTLFNYEITSIDNADPNLQGENGNTPLHTVCLQANKKNGYNEDIVELLIQNKANPNIKNKNNNTVLHSIVSRLKETIVIKMMNTIFEYYDNTIINLVDQNTSSSTLLSIACENNYTTVVRLLLDKSKESNQNIFFQTDKNNNDVWLRDAHDQTPLHHAAIHGNLEIVQSILKKLQQEFPEKLATFMNLQDKFKQSAAHDAALRFAKLLRLVNQFSLTFIDNNPIVNTIGKGLLTISATKQNEENITNEQFQYISELEKVIESWKLPTDIDKLEKVKEKVKKNILKFQDAQNVYTILTQNDDYRSLVDNKGQTPQTIFDKYAPVMETALSIIAEKLGLEEEATQLKEPISPIPEQSSILQEVQVPVKQPTITEEEEKVVEQIPVVEQPQTFWQKYKTIFAISGTLTVSSLLYKLYRKYQKNR